jgi:hypothetical protein
MERKVLIAAAANYPYLQGLWVLPLGFMLILAGLSNLQRRPEEPWMSVILAGGLVLCGAAIVRIARYYRQNYGEVTPTRSRQVRHAVAVGAWLAVLFVVGGKFLFWSPDSPVCVYAAAFSLATLVYYAILTGLRTHHLVIWGSLLAVGLLPIWGGLGPDRDAIAMFPLGVALMVSGLLDQRLLMRAFGSTQHQNPGSSHAAA